MGFDIRVSLRYCSAGVSFKHKIYNRFKNYLRCRATPDSFYSYAYTIYTLLASYEVRVLCSTVFLYVKSFININNFWYFLLKGFDRGYMNNRSNTVVDVENVVILGMKSQDCNNEPS